MKMERIAPSWARQERRRMMRRPVDIPAALSGSLLRKRHYVMLTDITPFGCGFAAAGRFNPGDFLMLSVPSFGPFGGTVVWAGNERVGFRFAEPLHPAVVEHIRQLDLAPTCPIERRWRRLAPLAGR